MCQTRTETQQETGPETGPETGTGTGPGSWTQARSLDGGSCAQCTGRTVVKSTRTLASHSRRLEAYAQSDNPSVLWARR